MWNALDEFKERIRQENLSIRDLQKENRRLKKLNEYLESILTKKQDRTYEHYKVLTEHLDETEDLTYGTNR